MAFVVRVAALNCDIVDNLAADNVQLLFAADRDIYTTIMCMNETLGIL